MKKMLLAVLSLISITCFSQTTGHLRFDTVRIYKVGGNSTLAIENDTRDTLGFLLNYENGRTRFERIRAIAGGIQAGFDTILVNTSCEDGVIFGRTVTWEGGFRFHVQEGRVQINCQLYDLDSVTLTLDSSDADDRFDVIYDDVDGAHILKGTPATPANIPQVTGEQIHLTAILIEAGALNPSVSSVNVYFENDATITPTGTTAVGNSTAAPFAGTFHIRITTVGNGDFVDIIKPSGTWDISDQDALVIHIKNRAVVPQLFTVRASIWDGPSTGSQVSGEVTLAYNKFNITTYQAVAIPMSAFGQITNTNVDRIRLRFTNTTAATITGFDIDNVFFEDGVPQPGNGGTGQFNLNVPAFLTLTPSNTIVTDNTTYTLTANGTTAQYVRGDGSLATFSAVTGVGTFNTVAASNNGAEVSGTNIFFHPVSATVNGMATPAMKEKWDSIYYAENMSLLGDSIMVSIAVDRIGFKSLVEGTGITITPTDSTLIIEASGGGGSSLFPVIGTGTATGAVTGDIGANAFLITSTNDAIITIEQIDAGLDWSNRIELTNNVLALETTSILGDASINLGTSVINFNSGTGNYQFEDLADDLTATKVVVYNPTSDQIGTVDLAGIGGGGGGATTALDNLAAVAINTSLISDADNTDDLGSAANGWKDGYFRRILLDGATSGTITLASDALSNVALGTNLSGAGIIPFVQSIVVRSDETLANSSADQNLYTNTAHDVITVQANTTYEFYITGDFTHGAVSHSIALGFTPTTAVVTSIEYNSRAWVTAVGTPTASDVKTRVKTTATNVINLAGANATESFEATGTITIGATGGTITPQIKFSADPTGTILLKAGARMFIWPVGNDTFTQQGNIN